MEKTRRQVKSFVRREGRLTQGQLSAFTAHWQTYGIEQGPIDLSAVFLAPQQPLILEIGFGDGRTLGAQVLANAGLNFIGVEVYRSGIGRLLSQVVQHGVNNLRLICHDAEEVLSGWFAPAVISCIQIYFPDPWPKKRHHKRRLIQPALLDTLHKVLKPGGFILIATDWPDYADHIATIIGQRTDFVTVASVSHPLLQQLRRPLTKFEEKGIAAARPISEFFLQKR